MINSRQIQQLLNAQKNNDFVTMLKLLHKMIFYCIPKPLLYAD